jgi:hypothetical protein
MTPDLEWAPPAQGVVPREQLLDQPQAMPGANPLAYASENERRVAEARKREVQDLKAIDVQVALGNSQLENFGLAMRQGHQEGWGRNENNALAKTLYDQQGFTAEQYAEMKARRENRVDYTQALPGLAGVLVDTYRMGGDLSRYAWEGKEGAAAGATTGLVLGGVPGAMTGAGLGMTLDASLTYEFENKRAELFERLWMAEDFEGNRIDVDTAKTLANAAAGLNTMIEAVGLHVVAKLIPGVKKLSSMPADKLADYLLKNPAVRAQLQALEKSTSGTVVKSGAVFAAGVGAEVVEEVAVAAVDLMAEAAGTEGTLNRDVGEELGAAAVESIGPMALFMAGPAVADFTLRERKRRKQAELGQKLASAPADTVRDMLAQNPTPRGIGAVADLLNGHPVGKQLLQPVGIAADDVRKLFQFDNEDFLNELATEYPHLAAALDNADRDPAKVVRFNEDSRAFAELVFAADKYNVYDDMRDNLTYEGMPPYAKNWENAPVVDPDKNTAKDTRVTENSTRAKLLAEMKPALQAEALLVGQTIKGKQFNIVWKKGSWKVKDIEGLLMLAIKNPAIMYYLEHSGPSAAVTPVRGR